MPMKTMRSTEKSPLIFEQGGVKEHHFANNGSKRLGERNQINISNWFTPTENDLQEYSGKQREVYQTPAATFVANDGNLLSVNASLSCKLV